MALGCEMAFAQAQRDEQKHQHADEDMETVKTGQQKEGRAEDA